MPAAAAVAVVGVLLLAGCLPVKSYPSDEDRSDEFKRQHVLSLSWENLRLVGFDKPAPEVRKLQPSDDWSKLFTECTSAVVPENFGYGYSVTGGYTFAEYDTPTRLAIYGCLASMPLDPTVDVTAFSPEQLEFLYEYHVHVLVPCLKSQGMQVDDVPTWDGFVRGGGQWSPFTSLYLVSASDWRRYVVAYTRCTDDPIARDLVAGR